MSKQVKQRKDIKMATKRERIKKSKTVQTLQGRIHALHATQKN